MKLFDTFGLAVLVVSTLIGFMRGASREVVNLASLVIASAAAISGLRYTAPVVARVVDATWLAVFLSLVVVFAMVYLAVHALGTRTLTNRNGRGGIGALDRGLGAGLGFGRGLAGLSLLVLGLQSITPPERMPGWVTDAELYPLASSTATLIRYLAPEGMAMASGVKPAIARSLSDGIASANAQDEATRPNKLPSAGDTAQ